MTPVFGRVKGEVSLRCEFLRVAPDKKTGKLGSTFRGIHSFCRIFTREKSISVVLGVGCWMLLGGSSQD